MQITYAVTGVTVINPGLKKSKTCIDHPAIVIRIITAKKKSVFLAKDTIIYFVDGRSTSRKHQDITRVSKFSRCHLNGNGTFPLRNCSFKALTAKCKTSVHVLKICFSSFLGIEHAVQIQYFLFKMKLKFFFHLNNVSNDLKHNSNRLIGRFSMTKLSTITYLVKFR